MSRRAGPGRMPIRRRFLSPDQALRRLLRVVFGCLAWAVSPLPGLAQGPAAESPAAKYRIDKDRFIFGQIEDDAPARTEENNPSEYEAFNTVLLHARQFPAAELEKHAR